MVRNYLGTLSTAFLFAAAVVKAQQGVYYQCGGIGWTGSTTCVAGAVCTYQNDYYSQCIPSGAATTAATSSSKTSATTSSKTIATSSTTKVGTTTSSSPPSGGTSAASPSETASVGYAAGVTGGRGGTTTTVTTLDALTAAVTGDTPAIVIISGTITGNVVVKVGSNKTVVGKKGAALVGVGLRVIDVSNVIIRNIKISKVLAEAGDAVGIQASHGVWVDHMDLSSDRDHDKDYYDGLLDITHGCYGVTLSYNYLHDHWKAVLIGHSDSNGAEDGAIRVTLHHNYWYNLNSRMPSFRFGQGHIYNNYFLDDNDGINTRDGAQLLVQNNVFSGVGKPLYATDAGYAVASGNDFGEGTDTAPTGTLTTAPYSYSLDATSAVQANVLAAAGAILNF